MKLVVVESPAKAKTINKYLGPDFKVVASFGHIRDLPSKSGSVVPDEDFKLTYVIDEKSQKRVKELIKASEKAKEIYLATDPDREGESISWHVAEVIKDSVKSFSDGPFKRISFNEITKKSVLKALENPRGIDVNLVNAQQARRALDYLVGFTLSPILWRKLPGCKSAGRVQSVALRLICEREGEIEIFKKREYWDIELNFLNEKNEPFKAKLTSVKGRKLEKFSIENEAGASSIVRDLENKNFSVSSIEKKRQRRNPPPPFITSTLQQEASRKLGFGAKKTMSVAQKLYEGIDVGGETLGLITYMRTDGVTIAAEAVEDIRKILKTRFGEEYVPSAPREYKSKVKNAQEAHEAIRPTYPNLAPEDLKDKLEKDFFALYELIWKRTLACQAENALIDTVSAEIEDREKDFTARASGSTIAFDGFYKIYKEGTDDDKEEKEAKLPILSEGEKLKTESIIPLRHFTEPPPRYSEATLVKKLEELGIGRPSTYASILSVLQERKYVSLEKKRFFPEELGRLVTAFLVGFFQKYVEYNFTASLEDDLDKVAEGLLDWKEFLGIFWKDFNKNSLEVGEIKIGEVINYVEKSLEGHLFGEDLKGKKCPSCESGTLNLKLGKFGAFLACGRYPDCSFKKKISASSENGEEESLVPIEDDLIGKDEASGLDIYLKKGPYGFYLQLGTGGAGSEKPKRISVPSFLDRSRIDLDLAKKLLNLPLSLGIHPDDGKEISVNIGRYGPYIKYSGIFISIPKKYDIFSLTLDEALQIIASSKKKKTK